eukprot:13037898-Alexandrium_andersonii.AAC.1
MARHWVTFQTHGASRQKWLTSPRCRISWPPRPEKRSRVWGRHRAPRALEAGKGKGWGSNWTPRRQ